VNESFVPSERLAKSLPAHRANVASTTMQAKAGAPHSSNGGTGVAFQVELKRVLLASGRDRSRAIL